MFDNLSDKFSEAFKHLKGKGKITEANIEDTLKQVKLALLEADVNFKVVKTFVAAVKEKALGEKVLQGVEPGEQFVKIMHDELAKLMGNENTELSLEGKKPKVILIVGLNGAGKTTFSGKLALHLRSKLKKDALLVPADTFRPAAKDQLTTLAKNISVDIFDSDLSLGPAKVAEAGLKAAREQSKDVVIIDTAGRLHVDDDLMAEIKEVKRVLEGEDPEVLLVADAMTGQEAVEVAKSFHQALGLTGIALSKMDSDARGGAALSIRQVTGVPIKFFSSGEKMKDLDVFHPDRLAKRILDMGDVLTLVEKAEEAIDQKAAEKTLKNLEKNKFTIEDFMEQMEGMKKLGSMESIMKMIPGMGGMLKNVGDLSPAENELKQMRVICDSMTKEERRNYKVINSSRKERIAKGSGKQVHDVNQFLQKFKEMEKMMTGMFGMLKGGGGMPFPGMGGGMPGFRNPPQQGGKKKKKGKKRGPWGGFF